EQKLELAAHLVLADEFSETLRAQGALDREFDLVLRLGRHDVVSHARLRSSRGPAPRASAATAVRRSRGRRRSPTRRPCRPPRSRCAPPSRGPRAPAPPDPTRRALRSLP